MPNYFFHNTAIQWIYYCSVLTFILFAYDKHCAHYGKWRIPEAILMVLTVCMGSFGALCGMILFNHKVTKKLFAIGVPVLLLIQTLIWVYLLTR